MLGLRARDEKTTEAAEFDPAAPELDDDDHHDEAVEEEEEDEAARTAAEAAELLDDDGLVLEGATVPGSAKLFVRSRTVPSRCGAIVSLGSP